MSVLCPLSWGEMIDKITILEIKAKRLTDVNKLGNVTKELSQLAVIRDEHFPGHEELRRFAEKLKSLNEIIWVTEDRIRECEREQKFDDEFIQLARTAYLTNDKRAAIKRSISQLLGSSLIEEKSHSTDPSCAPGPNPILP